MSRTNKNVIMSIILVLLLGSMFFTMEYAKKDLTTNESNPVGMKEIGEIPPSDNIPENQSGQGEQFGAPGNQPPEVNFEPQDKPMDRPEGEGETADKK